MPTLSFVSGVEKAVSDDIQYLIIYDRFIMTRFLLKNGRTFKE